MTTTVEPPSQLRSWLQQLVGVIGAGGISLVLDIALLWLLTTPLDVNTRIAAATSFTVAGVLNFALNRRVFKGPAGQARSQGIRFLILFLVNLGVTTMTVPALAGVIDGYIDNRGSAIVVAKLFTVGVLVLFNTVMYRLWVFRADADPEADATS